MGTRESALKAWETRRANKPNNAADERQQVNLKLPVDVIVRAEALVPVLAQNKLLAAAVRVTPATVLRIALIRGLEILEQEGKEPNHE